MLVGLTVGICADSVSGQSLQRITFSDPPAISGDPTPTGQLALDPLGTITPADTDIALQWQRDEIPVPDEITSVYSKTSEDAGAELRVALHLTKAGFAPLTVYSNTIRIDTAEWVILGSVIHGFPAAPPSPSVTNTLIGS